MEYHLVSIHTCAIRFHPSVHVRQNGSDVLDTYSAYHYEANCITLYRWGRYSTGSHCEACGWEAQECIRSQRRPCFAESIENGVLWAHRSGRGFNRRATTPHWNVDDSTRGSSDAPTAALDKSALHYQLAGSMPT